MPSRHQAGLDVHIQHFASANRDHALAAVRFHPTERGVHQQCGQFTPTVRLDYRKQADFVQLALNGKRQPDWPDQLRRLSAAVGSRPGQFLEGVANKSRL